MKRDYLPTWLQRFLFGTLAVIVVLMPIHAFVSTWGGTSIGPLWLWKSWKEILLVLTMLPVIVWLSVKPTRWKLLSQDFIFWLIIGFIGIVIVGGIYHAHENGWDAAAAGLAMNSRYLLVFGLGYVLFRYGRFAWPKVRRMIALFLIGAGTVLAITGLVQVWLLPADFLTQFGYDKHATIAPFALIDDNPEALRAFATLRGPNDFGAFLLLPLLLSILFARRNKWFLISSLAILGGLFASGSRSAWVGAVIALGVLGVQKWGGSLVRSRRRAYTVGASVIMAITIGVAAINLPAVRLAVFHSSPGDSSLTEGSTDKHWQATADGLARVVHEPLGCGTGCAGPASYYSPTPRISENYYVQIAEETGLIGIALWIAIVISVGLRLWRVRSDWLGLALFASLAGLSVIGLWLHVWSDDPLSMTWWLLAGVLLGHYASASRAKAVS